MTDMLVKLYDLPEKEPCIRALKSKGILIRPARAHEKHLVTAWVKQTFSRAWASECSAGFSNHPISCLIGVRDGEIVGFACYDCTCKNFFGPTGVVKEMRKQGVGKALLLSCLHTMAAHGYANAVIGGTGPGAYYEKTVGAVPIEGSDPGIYGDKLMG